MDRTNNTVDAAVIRTPLGVGKYVHTSRLPVDNRLFSFALILYIAALYIASRNACKYCATYHCSHFSQFRGVVIYF